MELILPPQVCPNCREEFTPTSLRQTYCGPVCKSRAADKRRYERVRNERHETSVRVSPEIAEVMRETSEKLHVANDNYLKEVARIKEEHRKQVERIYRQRRVESGIE